MFFLDQLNLQVKKKLLKPRLTYTPSDLLDDSKPNDNLALDTTCWNRSSTNPKRRNAESRSLDINRTRTVQSRLTLRRTQKRTPTKYNRMIILYYHKTSIGYKGKNRRCVCVKPSPPTSIYRGEGEPTKHLADYTHTIQS